MISATSKYSPLRSILAQACCSGRTSYNTSPARNSQPVFRRQGRNLKLILVVLRCVALRCDLLHSFPDHHHHHHHPPPSNPSHHHLHALHTLGPQPAFQLSITDSSCQVVSSIPSAKCDATIAHGTVGRDGSSWDSSFSPVFCFSSPSGKRSSYRDIPRSRARTMNSS